MLNIGYGAGKNRMQDTDNEEDSEYDSLRRSRNVGKAHTVSNGAQQEEGKNNTKHSSSSPIDIHTTQDNGCHDEQDRTVCVIAPR
jgi:hypothetical protein